MIKVAICDDIEVFLKAFEKMLSEYSWREEYEVSTFLRAEELLESVYAGNEYNILFMDIVLDAADETSNKGTDVAKSIKNMYPETLIVYISTYDCYYKDMVQAEPFAFCDKNVGIEKFNKIMDDAIERLKGNRFSYSFNGEIHTVNLQDVLYMYSEHRKVYIKMKNGEETYFYSKLDDVESDIEGICSFFRRPNKSYLVNMKIAACYSMSCIKVRDEKIKISRKYKEKFFSYKEMRYFIH